MKKNKGITLVALILTIIVLLILAVVAISAVTGNGIIAHAKNAKGDYTSAQEEEHEELNDVSNWIEDNIKTKEIVTKTFKVVSIAGNIDGGPYTVEEGMTWGEWIDSKYNTDGWKISSDYANAVISKNSTIENGTCIIKEQDSIKFGNNEEDVTKYGVKATDVIDLETYESRHYAE